MGYHLITYMAALTAPNRKQDLSDKITYNASKRRYYLPRTRRLLILRMHPHTVAHASVRRLSQRGIVTRNMRPQPRASMPVIVDAPLGAAEKPIERLATSIFLTAAAIVVGFLCWQRSAAQSGQCLSQQSMARRDQPGSCARPWWILYISRR